MKLRQGNAYAAITVLLLIAILFMGMWSIMPSFAKIFSMFTDDSRYEAYVDQPTCEQHRGAWYGGSCHQLKARPMEVLTETRRVWLVAPFIFVIGLIFWYFTVASRKDPYMFDNSPPGGGFQ